MLFTSTHQSPAASEMAPVSTATPVPLLSDICSVPHMQWPKLSLWGQSGRVPVWLPVETTSCHGLRTSFIMNFHPCTMKHMAMAWLLIQGRRNSDNFDALKSIIITMWPQNGEARLAGRTLYCYCGCLGRVCTVVTWKKKQNGCVVSSGCLFCCYFSCCVMVNYIAQWWRRNLLYIVIRSQCVSDEYK